jgi:hypothetical protein
MFATKTQIAKMVVTQLIAFKLQRTAVNVICDRTDIDPDGTVINVSTGVAAEIAAQSAAPWTDRLVDKTIVTIQTFQNKTAPIK